MCSDASGPPCHLAAVTWQAATPLSQPQAFSSPNKTPGHHSLSVGHMSLEWSVMSVGFSGLQSPAGYWKSQSTDPRAKQGPESLLALV